MDITQFPDVAAASMRLTAALQEATAVATATTLDLDGLGIARTNATEGIELLKRVGADSTHPFSDAALGAVGAAISGVAHLTQAQDVALNWGGNDPAAQLKVFQQAVAEAANDFRVARGMLPAAG